MHILMTADTVGGVWTYTQELVSALVKRGAGVTLVSLGRLPRPDQCAWLKALPNVDFRPTEYRLEWMQGSAGDIEESKAYIEQVIEEVRPDLLHSNQYCYGAIRSDIPKIVVAHSDVMSWWVGVYAQEPGDNPWLRWYRETVTGGLQGADLVVAPSEWMMGKVREYYIKPAHARVIYNGRTPQLFDPSHAKESVVLSVGRLWDSGKQVQLLLTREHAAPVWIAGPVDHPEKTGRVEAGFNANGLRLWGEQSQDQLLSLFAQASIYAATSRYEPFGLAPVEAALSGCALVANDIPVFRELWGEAAVYFSKDDPDALAERIRELVRDPELRHDCARRAYERARLKFTAERMADEYDAAYHRISSLTEKAA